MYNRRYSKSRKRLSSLLVCIAVLIPAVILAFSLLLSPKDDAAVRA